MPPFVLTPTDLHIWLSSFQEQAGDLDSLWFCLAEDEKQRVSQFYFERDRIRFIQGRSWLKAVLANYLQIPPQNITLSYYNSGKPFLTADTSLHFNLSHADDVLALVISPQSPLGIDVEIITLQDIDSLLTPDVFTPQELHVLNHFSGPDQRRTFYELWVAKEATLKAWGVGLSYPLNRITFEQTNDDGVRRARDLDELHPPLCLFELQNIPSQYVGAVAMSDPSVQISYCNI